MSPSDPTALSLLPPAVAIIAAIVSRQVHLSLFAGIWLGWTVHADGDLLAGLAQGLDACIAVFKSEGNTKVIAFSALVGAVMALTQASGGVAGFVQWIVRRAKVDSPRRARMLSWFIGVGVFIESSITSLVNGAVCRPVFDRLKLPREKLAYLCDATSAPICILIPLNAWGAYVIGILGESTIVDSTGTSVAAFADPTATFVATMPYNFYAFGALALSFWIAWSGRDFGAMAAAERRAAETGQVIRPGSQAVASDFAELDGIGLEQPRAFRFVVPLLLLVAAMPTFLYLTDSGSTAVFYAVLLAAVASLITAMIPAPDRMTLTQATDVFFKGVGALMPLAILMVLAFALGATTKALGTNVYVAELAQGLPSRALIPLGLFGASCLIAFATGTSWGTFAIMLPIAIGATGVDSPLTAIGMSAVLGGGVFGDHCSPISDTTLVASLAAGSDHIDHVNTQLPYALTAAAAASALYLIAGLAVT